MTPSEYLEKAYSESYLTGASIKHVMWNLDDMLIDRKFADCKQILVEADVNRLNIRQLLSILTITLPFRGTVDERKVFYDRVEAKIKTESPKRWKKLLEGLK